MDLTCFSRDYAEAREKFLEICHQRRLTVESHNHPMQGRDNEQLALDLAFSGPRDAANLLVISSGCHGVEGFCGSAIQIDRLRDGDWNERCRRDNLAVLYLHALNPYGFSWLRRVNEDNVDLNRNFVDFGQPLADNPDYRALAPWLMRPGLLSDLRLVGYALRHGRKSLQAAISRGQHSDPHGLFFAGARPTWSNLTLRRVLREHARQCRRIAWIDVHTGLGPQGVGERIYKGRQRAEDIARARHWWGEQVTNSAEGNSVSARLNGTLDQMVMSECAQAQYNGLTLEYGTLPGRKVLSALRAEQWLQNHPNTAPAVHQRIKERLRGAFYPQRDGWKREVLDQAREVLDQALAGLASPLG
ncbi:M14 family metallopeptidase [Pseudomonas sp. MAHUQ-62]|uniref:M14 family metallopeptidase n=1 Tax=Pseudomonas sp. GCM10023245 TaxID=3252652 RepID=UPI003616000A